MSARSPGAGGGDLAEPPLGDMTGTELTDNKLYGTQWFLRLQSDFVLLAILPGNGRLFVATAELRTWRIGRNSPIEAMIIGINITYSQRC
jgi:hypothetical protein